MVVSSITTLLKLGLPLFASDEGSVKEGALCAIGVSEEDVGIAAGKIMNQIFEGKTVPKSTTVKTLKLFTSKKLNIQSKYPEVYYAPRA